MAPASDNRGDSYDLYVIVHPFHAHASAFVDLIRPLAEHETEQLMGVEGYYCAAIDSAIFNLRFLREFTSLLGTARIQELVSTWGRPLIAPEELSDEAREEFFLGHLAGYTTYIQNYPSQDETTPMLIRTVESLMEHAGRPPANARPPRLSTYSRTWLTRSSSESGGRGGDPP